MFGTHVTEKVNNQ